MPPEATPRERGQGPEQPGGEAWVGWRPAECRDLGQDPIAQTGRWLLRHRLGKLRRRLAQLGDLCAALLATGEMHLVFGPLAGVEGVEGVGGGKVVLAVHARSSSTGRRRSNPSLIRVFMVPSGASSVSATWR